MLLPKRIFPKFVPTNSYLNKMVWPQKLQNVYLARKTSDPNVISKTHDLVTKLHEKYPINICTDHRTYSKLGLPFVTPIANNKDLSKHIDLVLSLGGDGTVLRSTSMFQAPSEPPPPQLPISLGTLGFLLPFQYEKALSVFDDVYNNRANASRRSRLRMAYKKEDPLFALNDITIHRGQSPHLAHLDVYVNNQLLTQSIGDGVIISTPTGSTAYSLSSGGSIVHPLVESVLVTPVCPRSLSFRPVLFPVNSQIVIKLSSNARGPVSIHLDGSITRTMYRGDEIHICSYENEGVWFVSQRDDWVPRVNSLLGFNSQFGIPKINE